MYTKCMVSKHPSIVSKHPSIVSKHPSVVSKHPSTGKPEQHEKDFAKFLQCVAQQPHVFENCIYSLRRRGGLVDMQSDAEALQFPETPEMRESMTCRLFSRTAAGQLVSL
ncbi:unnamed protein product [Effrenium voratum]|uniref:Uncharacterized protein n=1 Tax=Effrenium voratum TaxID=2562239 RepID=A0AA36JHV6_9DINO|nr:unnamed protein product [Effrenium voratum]CAJ1426929.1 unnamed protein product [Effrenium voratum]|eukprot:CAMPEP_0181439586 /NCGR_PEP_ID=MMETSP1110-20121109/22508_1 /TAXON_ID=174948 /ORGANISM="Symbiodinium sp., Strain CCMP421" /LENGTH=109 /DNA_ID=CAMNT_0023563323 /DNA_START=40 /DNA_END=369 /DNA_ORIENTATION=+